MPRNLQETSDYDRRRIITAYENKQSVLQISDVMGIKRTTVHGIIKAYIGTGQTVKLPRGGNRPQKICEEHAVEIKGWIDNDCSITLAELKERCRVNLGIEVSERTIGRCIDSFSYTLKSIHAVPVRRNDEITIAERAEYCNEFMRLLSSVGAEQFFFVDEVGFSVNMRSTRGRSLRGTSAVHVIPALRTRNISVCCAMNTRGILHYSTKTSAYNTQTFCDFLRELLAKLTQKRIERGVIVLDNVPFHHSTDAKRVFEGTDHTMIYLPPYSPFLNPIENMFSKWKEGVKKSRPQNEDELMRLITEGSTLITEDNCQSFFRGMIGYIHRGILGDSIFD